MAPQSCAQFFVRVAVVAAGAALLLVASRLAARSVLLAGPSILAALMCVAAFILGCADWSVGRPAHARRAKDKGIDSR